MLASTWMDLVIGVDIHIVAVPTPAGPVPTPMPMPFTGMVIDPIAAAMNAAMGGSTVLINGLPATNCGTGVKNLPPHLPVPGPFVKGVPENDAELWFGGLNVEIGGSLAVRLGEIALSCSDPVRMPTSVVLAIPKGSIVLVPRPPVPDLKVIAQALAFKAAGKLLRKLQKGKGRGFFTKLSDYLRSKGPKSARLRQLWGDAVCFLTGHPVDVATGRVITSQLDIELTGSLPLRFERRYDSSASDRAGPLGYGWAHLFDEAVWVERGAVVYRGPDGREIEFSTLDFDDYVIAPGREVYEPTQRLTLRCLGQVHFAIRDGAGVVKEFALVPGGSRRVAKLLRTRNRLGEEQRLTYDERGELVAVRDPAGRELRFAYDRAGRISKLFVAGTAGRPELVFGFEYDAKGDLVTATDALGHSYRYQYVEHLLVEESDRNGLTFYFQYDGVDSTAKCVRTWGSSASGDTGIYDHVITYDAAGQKTLVENSLGVITLYEIDAAGQVFAITDALGRKTQYEYHETSGQKTRETDPAGNVTVLEYDAKGNLTRVIEPDGSALSVGYNSLSLPVRAIDAIGGEWQWGYDHDGRLIGRRDPLGRTTQFHWQGPRLVAVTDPSGQDTRLAYDSSGNLSSLTTPDGTASHWRYDSFGRCHTAVDVNGNQQKRHRDTLGRVVQVNEPDGNVRVLEYDPEGNVTRARDQQHDVLFQYKSMGRLTARIESGTRVEFHYDTEDQLVGIKNEHGFVYRFVLNGTGEVQEEHGFDGLRRRYLRDKASRVTEVRKPQGRVSKYSYDKLGRVLAVEHSDGTKETYTYRADGELLRAENSTAHLSFERDALGRIVKEIQSEGQGGDLREDWVSSEYNALGLRTRVCSSKGLIQEIRRNAMGDVIAIEADVASVSPLPKDPLARPIGDSVFKAQFERDRMGLELERTLPGGIKARWHRDQLGRPVRHEVHHFNALKSTRQYHWEPNDRLRTVIDALKGPTHYSHDEFGNLAAATYEDGRVDLRLPDAVGNLFKTPDKTDRKYGPAGELLESTDARGITRYEYDCEGNLRKKIEPDGKTWAFHFNGAGMLARVTRPDGEHVEFGYDPLGRRTFKRYRGKTTRFVWDGNVPIHQWVEYSAEALKRDGPPVQNSYERDIARQKRRALLSRRPSQGPPAYDPYFDAKLPEFHQDQPILEGTADSPITWLFDPESFAPLAKLCAGEHESIVTDHLGTPTAMYDHVGREVWGADIDVYGGLRNLRGIKRACPFRWPGQYEDEETGLYYNRFRYYDPESGQYASQDPIGLAGGPALYAYPSDPLRARDPLALSASCGSTPPRVDWDPKTGRFRDVASGKFIKNKDVPWPANQGFASKKPGQLAPGQKIDRYGQPGGNFLAPAGTPFDQRGLPAGYQAGKPYNQYEVVKPYSQVESGPIAPTPQFGSPGGGEQHMTTHSVQELVDMGVLKPI